MDKYDCHDEIDVMITCCDFLCNSNKIACLALNSIIYYRLAIGVIIEPIRMVLIFIAHINII